MRCLVAVLVLAGTLALSVAVPSASAQGPWWPWGPWGWGPWWGGPVLESFGFSGTTPFNSTTFVGPGGIQCQYGAFLTGATLGTTTLGTLSTGLSPFFTATAYGPFGPGPCVPPPFFGGFPFLGGLAAVVTNGVSGNCTLVGGLLVCR
jgi:hypothetical protein